MRPLWTSQVLFSNSLWRPEVNSRRARAWKSREKLPISIPSAFEDGKHPGTELLLPAPMKESKSSAFSSILPVYLSKQMDRIVAYWFAHSCCLLDCTNYCSAEFIISTLGQWKKDNLLLRRTHQCPESKSIKGSRPLSIIVSFLCKFSTFSSVWSNAF